MTIDTAFCQKRIAQEIIVRGGDSVLALKGNQRTLHQDVKGISQHVCETVDGDHGRIETRR